MPSDATTAAAAGSTDEGKPSDGQGNSDQVIAGLNRSLNAKVEEVKRLTAEVAKLAQEPDKEGKAEKLELKIKSLETVLKYPAEAKLLKQMLDRGVSPEVIDDEFVAALRAGATPKATEEDEGTPAHNPQRRTSGESPADQLKAMTTIFSD